MRRTVLTVSRLPGVFHTFNGGSTRTTSSAVQQPDKLSQVQEAPHVPVLVEDVLSRLQPKPGQTIIDMTYGAGGHTKMLFQACPNIKVIALDRDPRVNKFASQMAETQDGKFTFFNGKFTELLNLLAQHGNPTRKFADAVLFDAGVSSMQFNDRHRGLTLARKGPLDMRMNSKENTPTAADVLNKLEEIDIARILKRYGEEKKAKQIARAVVERRQMLGPMTHTRELQDLVSEVYLNTAKPSSHVDAMGRPRHLATLTFQALRIFVNDELNELYNGLKVAYHMLKPGGVCAAITFHSLEHNIVHQVFSSEDILLKQTPITEDLLQGGCRWKRNAQVIKASNEEKASNPRSRSAQLRSAIKQ